MLGAAETRALADEMVVVGAEGSNQGRHRWGCRTGTGGRSQPCVPPCGSRHLRGRKAKPSVSIHGPAALLFWCGFCQKRQMTERRFPPPWTVEELDAWLLLKTIR